MELGFSLLVVGGDMYSIEFFFAQNVQDDRGVSCDDDLMVTRLLLQEAHQIEELVGVNP